MRLPILFAILSSVAAAIAQAEIRNAQYTLAPQPNHAIEVRAEGTQSVPTQVLAPEFTVMFSERNPGFGMNWNGPFDRALPRPFPDIPFVAQRWLYYSDDPGAPSREIDALGVKSDIITTVNSKGERTLHYRDASGNPVEKLESNLLRGTMNPYLAGQKTELRATSSTISDTGNTVTWRFADQPGFTLSATVTLPEKGDPRINYRLHVKTPGYYSVAFTGTPWIAKADAIPVPHSTLNATRTTTNFLLSEARITLPRIHLATGRLNSIIAVDPAESPFRLVEDSKAVWTYALENESNSRFGLMTEEMDDRLRPIVFSPIMGGHRSRMDAGHDCNFTIRYILRGGDWRDSYKYIAREIYRFRDMRDNSGPGPMYKTIENLMDYLADHDGGNYSMWHAEQKYHNYWSDQSGIFKPFSPLFALSAAIITDDEHYYRTRALPMVEFALSRKTNMFAPYDITASGMVSTIESPLGSPYVDAGQLLSLDGMFQSRSHVFRHYAETQKPLRSALLNALAKYRVTGLDDDLADAEKKAGENPRGNFMDMLELYEETGAEKYLQAALSDAYRYAAIQLLFPTVPDCDILIDKGNVAPVHGHAYQRHEDWGFAAPRPQYASEQTVPAWRASLVGVELSAYRGGYWLNNHAQLMRLATHAGDDFLRDLQRWAMVGRFGNHAGYFRSNRHSLIAERADAPMRYIYDTNFSTFNPGHACEWIGAVIDFTVSDLFNRSEKQIDFPSRCLYSAAFRTKVYGDRPGRFYDETNVRLWMPRRLLEADNKQVDYLGAHGNGKFYVAFWNQSFRPEKVSIRLNPALVDCSGKHRARVWINNIEQPPVEIFRNQLNFEIPAKGIVAYAIENTKVTLGLQAKLLAPGAITLGKDSLATTTAPFGNVTAMLLSAGKGLTTAFVYTDAPAEKIISTKLRHRQGNEPWKEITDAIFPYEFSTGIDETKGRFECVLEVETAGQQIQKSPVITLTF